MWMGANAPERIERLVLSNTSRYSPTSRPLERPHQDRAAKRASPRSSAARWSAGSPRASAIARPHKVAKMSEMFLKTKPEGYIGCCEAVRDMDHREITPKHHGADAGHRGLAGSGDDAEDGRVHRADIPGAKLDDARRRASSRMSSSPRPTPRRCWASSRNDEEAPMDDARTAQTRRSRATPRARQRMGRPLGARTAMPFTRVSGPHHALRLGRNLDAAAFRRPHPARPGDRHHDRARPLGRIRLHVRAALAEGGFTADDIKEIILQQAIYVRRAGRQPRLQGGREQELTRDSAMLLLDR